MSTLVDLARPGGPIGVGSWGGFEFGALSGFGDIPPFRFFALRRHDRFVEMLSRHSSVEHVETMTPNPGFARGAPIRDLATSGVDVRWWGEPGGDDR